MKKLIGLLFALCFSLNAFASPLVFNSVKIVSPDDNWVVLGSFDATKYKQIRVGVSSDNVGWSQEIKIEGVETEGTLLILHTEERFLGRSFLIDTPPSQIRVSVKAKGKYSLHIWASQ